MAETEESDINQYMEAALAEARKAAAIGEVPIGAVVVHEGQIVGRGHNLRETSQDATQHAEIIAIQAACRKLGTWRLEDCQLFVTLEPCPMCAGAMINARIATCYFGATDPKAGVAGTFYNLLEDSRFNHQVAVVGGLKAAASAELLQSFFRTIRAKRKAAKQAGQTRENQV
ncbi:tRNA adenosine(34) deaminase TadA [Lacticaseibacillus casei]|nr:tRNA adenosine(34) deaminase TadA [Lacticaseibacillus casei]QXG58921.1 tRNA adenosine(34) deaminase TadA [Lacticaseibacillus casei]